MIFQLNSAVYDDLREAVGSQIALNFYDEFKRYAGLAAKSPLSYRIYAEDPAEIRRVNFRQFPYHFLFRRIDRVTIRILVVRHDHRHPSYGLDRW